MIDIYDDVLEEHNAILVDDMVRQISWKYDYQSSPKKPNKHWHVFCGHNEEECNDGGYNWAYQIFSSILYKYKFKEKYNVEGFVRIYCNAHTHGIEPQTHVDDGDFTMIYYPRLDWKTKWGGGTTIYQEDVGNPNDPNYKVDKAVSYKGNRLIIFDARLPHQAQPVTKDCYDLRSCVVFKCNIAGGNHERLDFYKDNLSKGNFKVKIL
jgi:Rps23 Pro-64 3,4-dihydroxylase Tpa1-like proline 4-hydroxylase